MDIPRLLPGQLRTAAQAFPAVVLTGPRRSGKTSLLRSTFPAAQWVLLEDPDVLSRVRSDPRGFLDGLKPPVILDEIQNAPELLAFVRTRIDHAPSERGRWLLTGSQEFSLMRGVTESMAGRAGVLSLLPFSVEETSAVSLLHGGFPEVVAAPEHARLWFSSYLQTWLERDVRGVIGVRDLALFRRFMSVVAARTGQLLNKTEIAAPLGVSVPTITAWIDALEATGVLIVVPPWFTNFGKRLLKSPKVYFCDPGLTCHLLGLDDDAALERSPMLGAIWEGFVASEIAKHRLFRGRNRGLFGFRDAAGLDVDFLVEGPGVTPILVEAKATRTPTPSDAVALRKLVAAGGLAGEHYVVHRRSASPAPTSALAPGVAAVDLAGLHAALDARGL